MLCISLSSKSCHGLVQLTTCLHVATHGCYARAYATGGLQVTAINLGGYLLAFFGVCWYNYRKLQGMKAKQAAAASAAAAAKIEPSEDSTLLGKNGSLNKSPNRQVQA